MLDALRGISLVAATITMGLVTGAFALYAHTIMPGLNATDDRAFVGAFQSIDGAIINPWFMAGGFVGALVFIGVAAALWLGSEVRSVHAGEDEMFYLLSGELVGYCGNENWTATAGSFVFVPREQVHGFTVTSDAPARVLVITGPPKLDRQIAARVRG